jgi:hypothetical protein
MKEEEKYEIPLEGSLGLLALGASGVRAWRIVREEHASEKQENDKG